MSHYRKIEQLAPSVGRMLPRFLIPAGAKGELKSLLGTPSACFSREGCKLQRALPRVKVEGLVLGCWWKMCKLASVTVKLIILNETKAVHPHLGVTHFSGFWATLVHTICILMSPLHSPQTDADSTSYWKPLCCKMILFRSVC